jgi:hypothetical protein
MSTVRIGTNWWKYAAVAGAGAIGGVLLGGQLAPPKQQNIASPGGIVMVEGMPSSQSSGSGDLLGGLTNMLPLFLIMMMLPQLMKGFKNNEDD